MHLLIIRKLQASARVTILFFVDQMEQLSILIISGARCSIQRWTERASSAVTAHMASTSFAIQLLAYCTRRRMICVQQFLRHSQIGTTADIYEHKSPVVVRKASELLASELDRC